VGVISTFFLITFSNLAIAKNTMIIFEKIDIKL